MTRHCCVNNKQTTVFTKEEKKLIKAFQQEEGYGAKFIKEFLNRNWSLHL